MYIDRSFWKLDTTSLAVGRLKNDIKHLKNENKELKKVGPDKSFRKLYATSLTVASLKVLVKDLKAWNKEIKKDHRRLEIENTVLRARVARLELPVWCNLR